MLVPAELLHHLLLCDRSTFGVKHKPMMYTRKAKCRCFGLSVCDILTFVSFLVHILGLYEPVHVSDHVLLHLLALLRLLQLTSGHGLLSFLGELSVRQKKKRKSERNIQGKRYRRVLSLKSGSSDPPAQHTQYEIDDEKGSKDDERNKVNPWDLEADGVVHLCRETEREKAATGKRAAKMCHKKTYCQLC